MEEEIKIGDIVEIDFSDDFGTGSMEIELVRETPEVDDNVMKITPESKIGSTLIDSYVGETKEFVLNNNKVTIFIKSKKPQKTK